MELVGCWAGWEEAHGDYLLAWRTFLFAFSISFIEIPLAFSGTIATGRGVVMIVCLRAEGLEESGGPAE